MTGNEPSSGQRARTLSAIAADLVAALGPVTAFITELRERAAEIAAAPPPPEPRPAGPTRPARFPLRGQMLTKKELAALAGCSLNTLEHRLKSHSIEDAVAMGAADIGRARRGKTFKAEAPPAPPAPAPTPRRSVFEHRAPPPPPPAQASPRVRIDDFTPGRLASGSKLAGLKTGEHAGPRGEVITPANVVRVVAPTPPERFAVEKPESTFSRLRPGQYLDEESHLGKVYGAGR